jgi:hypothetical protein
MSLVDQAGCPALIEKLILWRKVLTSKSHSAAMTQISEN